MKRGCALLLAWAITVSIGSGAAEGIAAKEGVMRAKSGKGRPTASAGGSRAVGPDFYRLGQAYRAGKAGTDRATKSYSSQGSLGITAVSQWARARRSYQVRERKNAEIHTHLERGTVAIKRRRGKESLGVRGTRETCAELVLRYVDESRGEFGLEDSRAELGLRRQRKDHLGATHVVFEQRLHDVRVWGKALVGHVNAEGELESINCLVEPSVDLPEPEPNVWAEEAIEIAKGSLAADGNPVVMTAEQAEAMGFSPTSAELYYWQEAPRGEMELVWVVEIRPNVRDWMRFFIAASDGFILNYYNATAFDGPATVPATNYFGETVTIDTYEINGTYYLINGAKDMFVGGQTSQQLINNAQGAIIVMNMNHQDDNNANQPIHFTSANNTWDDGAAVCAMDYASQVYDFYTDLPNYGRNSFDNAGKSMILRLHVTDGGKSQFNAYWNGLYTVWGDGGNYASPLSGGRDVVGHEFTHAVVQYTANLEYQYQSGALNETYADIGGVSVDNDNFLLAEEVMNTQRYKSGALRDMGNPHNGGSGPSDAGWQPAHMDEYIQLPNTQGGDWGGVHVNNGISNFAAYKIFTALGRAKAEQVLYCALVDHLHANSDFTDWRIAVVQCAGDLYGDGSAEETAVKQAFDEVGIVAGSGTPAPPDRPAVVGSQYVVMANDEFDFFSGTRDHSLLISDGFDTVEGLNSATFWYSGSYQVNVSSGRPIAVDPYGQDIYYVNSAHNLVSVLPNGTGEHIVDGSGDWWSLAISPSGRYLAMTRSYDENSIWLYDFSTDPCTLTEMTLFHPTTDHGGGYADIVEYADSLVFIDDQHLAYDCVNTMQSPSGESISFWDVNIIDIYSGQIVTVLPPQSGGVNVGNPVVASTNPSILAVEFYNPIGPMDDVVGVNLVTGQASTIVADLADVAYPDYSPDDNHMLYTAFDPVGLTNDVYIIGLEDDKISASGPGAFLLQESRLPLWFVVGTAPTAAVGFAAPLGSGSESSTTVTIPVTLTVSSAEEITIDYEVTGGNAIGGGVDYLLDDGMVTFSPGESMQNITIDIVDDAITEGAESISIALSRPVNAWLGDNTNHVFTISDDDKTQDEIGLKNNKARVKASKGICKFTATSCDMTGGDLEGVCYVRLYNRADKLTPVYIGQVAASEIVPNNKGTSASYKSEVAGGIKSIKISFAKDTFTLATKGADLGNLAEPIYVEIETNTYLGYGP